MVAVFSVIAEEILLSIEVKEMGLSSSLSSLGSSSSCFQQNGLKKPTVLSVPSAK